MSHLHKNWFNIPIDFVVITYDFKDSFYSMQLFTNAATTKYWIQIDIFMSTKCFQTFTLRSSTLAGFASVMIRLIWIELIWITRLGTYTSFMKASYAFHLWTPILLHLVYSSLPCICNILPYWILLYRDPIIHIKCPWHAPISVQSK